MKLLQTYTLGKIKLKNRVVMAPMTRSRAINNIPNDLMAEYYSQRSGAGLIITEGTAPSPNGVGYPRIPGIYSDAQVEGWQKVTEAVHEEGGKIFLQLMHTGRVGHPLNMPEGARHIAPSAIKLEGQMYTDQEGPQDYPTPRAMTGEEIEEAIHEYRQSAINAIKAGFDGVEIHGANGYLIEQFLNTATNIREDKYGGSVENRNRFAIEVATEIANAIGSDRTGIRLSPYGVFNGIEAYDGIDEAFEQLASELGKLNLAYIHIVDHSSMGAPDLKENIKSRIHKTFGGTVIVSGGLDAQSAEKALQNNLGELAAFGRPFISNPDLVYRIKNDIEWADADSSTFYTPGEEGYTDYSMANASMR